MTDQYVDTALARFRYARTGMGTPALLLPGSGGWRLTFHTMAAVLAERHTVFALDPPGQGLTEVLDPDFGYDADAIARSIAVFLDAVGLERTAIVGHSWGGGFALRFAELYPDRLTRLALLAPGGLDVKDIWEFRLLRLQVLGELAVRLTSTASVRHLLRKSFVRRERIPEDLIGEVVQELRSGRNRVARLTDMLRVERSVSWVDTELDLHLVHVPVLLLWGSKDRYFPVRLIERFIARLPTVEHHVLRDCGHSLHDDCPEQTYALLSSFLQQDTSPSPPCDRRRAETRIAAPPRDGSADPVDCVDPVFRAAGYYGADCRDAPGHRQGGRRLHPRQDRCGQLHRGDCPSPPTRPAPEP